MRFTFSPSAAPFVLPGTQNPGTQDSSVADLNKGVLLAACAAALLTLVPVAAHQLGYLEHLPDPPGGLFASDEITESTAAHPAGIPDGVLGLASFAVTFGLILEAGDKRHSRRLGRRLLTLKLAADGSMAGFNFTRQIVSFRRLCSWCTGTAICTAAMILAARKLIAAETAALRLPTLCAADRSPQRSLKETSEGKDGE